MRIPRANIFGLASPVYPRKGGGGHGGGHSSGGRASSHAGGSSAKSGSVSSSGRSIITSGRTSKTVSSSGNGGGRPIIIVDVDPFSDGHRTEGGGDRAHIYGTIVYGSGYPNGNNTPGVKDKDIPYYFWPIPWSEPRSTSFPILDGQEYGPSTNVSRPGGPLVSLDFKSNSTGAVYRITSDNTTISALHNVSFAQDCTSYLDMASSGAVTLVNDTLSASPYPEEALMYYRASSIVLTLDGYNNTAAMLAGYTVPNAALPTGHDVALFNCLNNSIGTRAPLVDGASHTIVLSLLFLFYLVGAAVFCLLGCLDVI